MASHLRALLLPLAEGGRVVYLSRERHRAM